MKLFYRSLLLLAALFSSLAAKADSIADCRATIVAYAELRDHGPRKEYQALFTADAKFEITSLNIHMEGADVIGERLDLAHKSGRSIHAVASPVITRQAVNQFASKTYFSVWLGGNDSGSFPERVSTGRYVDLLEHDGIKCRIKNRQVLIDNNVLVKE